MAGSHALVQKTTKYGSVNVARTGTHGLRADRLRVGYEQRTRVMARCWETRGGLGRWYIFDLSSQGRSNNSEAASVGKNIERGFPRFPGRIPPPGTSFLVLHRDVESLSDRIISTLHDAPSS